MRADSGVTPESTRKTWTKPFRRPGNVLVFGPQDMAEIKAGHIRRAVPITGTASQGGDDNHGKGIGGPRNINRLKCSHTRSSKYALRRHQDVLVTAMRAILERTPRGYQRDLSLNDPAPEEPEVASSEVTQSGNSLENSTRKGPNSCTEMGNCNAWTVEAAPAPINSQFAVYLAESIFARWS